MSEELIKPDTDTEVAAVDPHEGNRSKWFLASLIALFLLNPFYETGRWYSAVLLLVSTIVMLTGIFATARARWGLVVGVATAIPFLVSGLFNLLLAESDGRELMVGVAALPFFGFTFFSVFSHVLRGDVISRDKLYGSVCAYLLMGMIGAGLFSVVQLLHPGSFRVEGVGTEVALRFPDMIYFSFVTLTTVGYGDIVPVTRQAQMLAILEAIAGVFYLALLVARMVGMYRHQQTRI